MRQDSFTPGIVSHPGPFVDDGLHAFASKTDPSSRNMSERSTNITIRYQGRTAQSTLTINPQHTLIAPDPGRLAVDFTNGSSRGHHGSSDVMHCSIAEGLESDSSGYDTTHTPTSTQDNGSNSIVDAASSNTRCYQAFPRIQLPNDDQSFDDTPRLTVAHEGVRMASTQMTNQVTPH
jgi:hypothetical protein